MSETSSINASPSPPRRAHCSCVIDVHVIAAEHQDLGQDGGSSVLAPFGAEEFLSYLHQEGITVAVVAVGAEGRRLLKLARLDTALSRLPDGLTIIEDDRDKQDDGSQLVQLAACALPPDARRGLCVVLTTLSEDGGERIVGRLLPWPAPSPRATDTPLPPGLVAEDLEFGARANGHGKGGEQRVSCLADLDPTAWGLPPWHVNPLNPPFEWPAHFERDARAALQVEARYVDQHHQQLSVLLGRAVRPSNVLDVVRAEVARAGADEDIDSIFVTVRHDFAVMSKLLADGYRIHHSAKGGTQVVLLRRLVPVEVPTAGTHISRSKVVLFRRGGEGEEEQVFLFRRRAKGIWKIPGGHVEMKELADEAAVREVREETGYACRVVALVALSERKNVDKKWGCSQLMFTFAAEWLQSELRLDDATSREGRWFPVSAVDQMASECSASIDPALRKVWWSFRRKDRWFTARPQVVDPDEESCKRYYLCDSAFPAGSSTTPEPPDLTHPFPPLLPPRTPSKKGEAGANGAGAHGPPATLSRGRSVSSSSQASSDG